MKPFPSRNEILVKLDKTIKEKPNLSDWTNEEKRMLSYMSFCDNIIPAEFLNILFYIVIIYILSVIINIFGCDNL